MTRTRLIGMLSAVVIAAGAGAVPASAAAASRHHDHPVHAARVQSETFVANVVSAADAALLVRRADGRIARYRQNQIGARAARGGVIRAASVLGTPVRDLSGLAPGDLVEITETINLQRVVTVTIVLAAQTRPPAVP